MRRRSAGVVGLGAAFALAFGGCSVSPGDKVSVGLEEWKIDVSPSSVRSGRVQFEIDNEG